MYSPSEKNNRYTALFSLLLAPMAQAAMIRLAEGFQFSIKALNSLLWILSGKAVSCHFTIHRVYRSVRAGIVSR
jgi:hypothetical protein